MFLQDFQKMTCMFRGRRSTLDVPSFILRGKRSTLKTSGVAYIWRIALSSGLREVVTTCKLRGRRGTSNRECQFACQAQHLVQIRRVWNVILRGRQDSTLLNT